MGEQKGADGERRGGAASEGGAEGGWVTSPSPSCAHPVSLPGNQGWVGGAPTQWPSAARLSPGTHPIQVSAPMMLPCLYFYLPRASLRTCDFMYRFKHVCFYICVTVDPFIYDSACMSVTCASITILEMQQKNLSCFFLQVSTPNLPPPPFMMHSLRH